MKNSVVAIILFVLATSLLFAQHSDPTLRRIGYMTGNQIGISFYNDGQISGFNTSVDIRGEWPLGSGENYIGDMIPMIGLEFINQLGDTIHSVIISRGPRFGQSNEQGPNGFRGLNPLPGFLNTGQSSVAMSNHPASWPPTWADHPEYGSNVWNGFFGPDSFVADLETYFQMDDYWDDEFNSYFHPDSTDTTRTGHGINVAVRYFQLTDPLFKDVLIKMYDIINTGTTRYEKVVFGAITTTLTGGDGDSGDDISILDQEHHILYSYDADGIGNIGQRVAVAAEGFLETPAGYSIGSFQYFHIASSPNMSDDTLLWNKLKEGNLQTIPSPPQDGDCMFGTRFFSLAPGETVSVALVSGFDYTKEGVTQKILSARALWGARFNIDSVLSSITLSNMLNHRMLSGAETLEWSSTNNSGTIALWYSPDNGETWRLIHDSIPNTGSFLLVTDSLQDSPFGIFKLFIKKDDGTIAGFTESHAVTINNTANSAPFVRILIQGFQKDSLLINDSINMQLLIGDAENDSLSLTLMYSVDDGSTFHTLTSSTMLPDTLPQFVTIDLTTIPNSNKTILKFLLSDDSLTSSAVTERFKKQTPRDSVDASHQEIVSGFVQIPWKINIVDSSQLTGNEYRIIFDDSSSSKQRYAKYITVIDATLSYEVMSKQPIQPFSESPLFDGFSFYQEDIATTMDSNKTHWSNSVPQLQDYLFRPFVWSTSGPGTAYNGFAMPNDYSIIFYPDIVDTSLADTLYPNTPSNRLPATPVSFHVKNLSTNQFVDFCYRKNSFSSSTNYVIYFKEQLFSKLTRTWSVTLFFNGANAPLPTADTLYLYTKKGFSMFDTIRVFGVTTGIGDNPQLPNGYSLEQNYPNPFNPSTVIRYSLPVANHVLLKIYDILGREIATLVNETKPAGSYNVTWDASGLPSGIYFYRMQAGSFIQNKKLLLIK